jgi:SHS2 domain-containing protein
MANYRFLEHTADVLFEAWGGTYPQMLEHAAEAMFSLLGSAEPKEKITIEERAENKEELAVRFLSTLLAEADANGMVLCKFKIEKFDEKKNAISAIAYGERKNAKDSIKAVTYHELMVKKEKGKWLCRILLDV